MIRIEWEILGKVSDRWRKREEKEWEVNNYLVVDPLKKKRNCFYIFKSVRYWVNSNRKHRILYF